MPSQHTTAHSPTAAAAMRTIGINRRHPLPNRHSGFLCSRGSTSWTAAETDCFSCGLPATQEHSHPHAALQILLVAVGRTPVFKADPQPEESW